MNLLWIQSACQCLQVSTPVRYKEMIVPSENSSHFSIKTAKLFWYLFAWKKLSEFQNPKLIWQFSNTLKASCLSREYFTNSRIFESTEMSKGISEASPPSLTQGCAAPIYRTSMVRCNPQLTSGWSNFSVKTMYTTKIMMSTKSVLSQTGCVMLIEG